MNQLSMIMGLSICLVLSITPEAKLKITGHIDVQGASSNFLKRVKYAEANITLKNILVHNYISTSTYFNLKTNSITDSGLKYGGIIKLSINTLESKKETLEKSNSNIQKMIIYLENKHFHIEIGNYTGITNSMKINPGTFASATGGINGDCQYYWNTEENTIINTKFLRTANLPTNDLGTFGIYGINSPKINYYSKEFSGFRFGATFTPNLKSYEIIHLANNTENSFKNIFETALSYTGEIKNIGIKFAIISEFAKNKNNEKNDLKAFELGTNISYDGFTIGGAYGNWSKFDIEKTNIGGKTSYKTGGIAYLYGPLSLSITYLQSKKEKSILNKKIYNEFTNTVVGFDYKIASGLLSYIECASFKMLNEMHEYNKGSIFIVGIKLNF